MKGHPAVVVVVVVVVFFLVYVCFKSNNLGGSSYLTYVNFLPPPLGPSCRGTPNNLDFINLRNSSL